MRRLALAALLLALALPLKAEEEAPKPKPRSFPELIALIMKEGEAKSLDAETSANLGLPKARVPVKRMGYWMEMTADKREHMFNVIISPENPPKPKAIVLSNTRVTVKNGAKSIDGLAFRATLDGRLKGAVSVNGPKATLKQTKLSPDASDVKDKFQAEMDFWLSGKH